MKILLLVIISFIVFLIIESIRERKGSRETSKENKETSMGENSTYKNIVLKDNGFPFVALRTCY